MRKLNGITINGEYLGNSVVINGMFRAICTISPIIMRDFVQIINKIEKFDEAVKIHNFNCGFDCIDIEFCNNQSKGIASLYFKLINGDPELTNCKLIIDGKEYSTFQEKITLPQQKNKDMPKTSTMSEDERAQKIRELKEKKLEKLRQAEALRCQKLNNAATAAKNPEAKNASALTSPMAGLSEEERMKRKRQELLERKKKLIEAKKAALQNSSNADSEAASMADSAAISTDNNSTISADGENLSKSDGEISSKKADGTVSDSEQTTANSAEVSAGGDNENSVNNKDNNSETASSNTLDGTGSSDNEVSANEFNENNIDDMADEYGDISDFDDNVYGTGKKSFEDLTDEELENMSEEELAALEAELDAELGADDISDGMDDFGNYSVGSQGFDRGFAESLSQGLAQGLSEGLTQGLTGLVQGLSQLGLGGGNGMGNQNFGGGFNDGMGNQNFGGGFNDGMGNQNFGGGFNNGMGNQSFGGPEPQSTPSSGYNFSEPSQNFNSSPQTQYSQLPPDYSKIDDMNSEAAMMARDSYSYDENTNMDDLSDLYSDFYEEKPDIYDEGLPQQQIRTTTDPAASEVDALKAELEALKAQTETKKDLMTLDEFLAKQKELEDVKEQRRRQKLKIVGSRGRVNASALDGGVFVSGKKVYKWGDTKVLNE